MTYRMKYEMFKTVSGDALCILYIRKLPIQTARYSMSFETVVDLGILCV